VLFPSVISRMTWFNAASNKKAAGKTFGFTSRF
jgi:hypothetical protein